MGFIKWKCYHLVFYIFGLVTTKLETIIVSFQKKNPQSEKGTDEAHKVYPESPVSIYWFFH